MPRPASGAAPPRSHTTWPIPPYRRASPPPQSGTTGTSRTRCTTLVTSLSRKINPASVVTRVSSCGCAASPTMCYAATEPAPSVRTDTPPLSLDSMPSPTGASVESIKQPWFSRQKSYQHPIPSYHESPFQRRACDSTHPFRLPTKIQWSAPKMCLPFLPMCRGVSICDR